MIQLFFNAYTVFGTWPHVWKCIVFIKLFYCHKCLSSGSFFLVLVLVLPRCPFHCTEPQLFSLSILKNSISQLLFLHFHDFSTLVNICISSCDHVCIEIFLNSTHQKSKSFNFHSSCFWVSHFSLEDSFTKLSSTRRMDKRQFFLTFVCFNFFLAYIFDV